MSSDRNEPTSRPQRKCGSRGQRSSVRSAALPASQTVDQSSRPRHRLYLRRARRDPTGARVKTGGCTLGRRRRARRAQNPYCVGVEAGTPHGALLCGRDGDRGSVGGDGRGHGCSAWIETLQQMRGPTSTRREHNKTSGSKRRCARRAAARFDTFGSSTWRRSGPR